MTKIVEMNSGLRDREYPMTPNQAMTPLQAEIRGIRMQISKAQNALAGFMQVPVSVVVPGTLDQRQQIPIFSDCLQQCGGELGIVHIMLGYYLSAVDTDKSSYPYNQEIKSIADVKPAVDRETGAVAIVIVENEVVMTTAMAQINYTPINRFAKVAYLRKTVQSWIDKVMELPAPNELAKIRRDAAIIHLTLAKAMLGEHYQELLSLTQERPGTELID